MEILKPNTGEKTKYIPIDNVYVLIWDYGVKAILLKVKMPIYSKDNIGFVWVWNELKSGSVMDLSEVVYTAFDQAVNRAVNNAYCTVYMFDNYDDMIKNWNNIKYVETKTTEYKILQEQE